MSVLYQTAGERCVLCGWVHDIERRDREGYKDTPMPRNSNRASTCTCFRWLQRQFGLDAEMRLPQVVMTDLSGCKRFSREIILA